jgi:hypothetical protein
MNSDDNMAQVSVVAAVPEHGVVDPAVPAAHTASAPVPLAAFAVEATATPVPVLAAVSNEGDAVVDLSQGTDDAPTVVPGA